MFQGMSGAQKIIGGVIVVVAVVGWIMAINAMGSTSDLEAKVASAEADLKKSAEELAAAQKSLEQYQKVAASLEEMTGQVEGAKAELAALDKLRIEAKQQQMLLSQSALKYRTKSRVRVRAEPSTDAPELTVLQPGITVEVFEVVEDGTWFKVGVVGYIFHELLEPVEE